MSLDNVPLTPRVVYALSAPTYDAENVITVLEDRAVSSITPPLQRKSLLDAACGTGRRLPLADGNGPHTVFGIDLVFDMIALARSRPAQLAVADMHALPCRAACFDVVWCRLALGHVRDVAPAYRELARVARPGAHIVVSDFHPAAARAGHVRTFRAGNGERLVVEHHIHDAALHEHAARAAGLDLLARLDCAVGPAVRHFYLDAGRRDLYEQQRGLPLVLVLGFRA